MPSSLLGLWRSREQLLLNFSLLMNLISAHTALSGYRPRVISRERAGPNEKLPARSQQISQQLAGGGCGGGRCSARWFPLPIPQPRQGPLEAGRPGRGWPVGTGGFFPEHLGQAEPRAWPSARTEARCSFPSFLPAPHLTCWPRNPWPASSTGTHLPGPAVSLFRGTCGEASEAGGRGALPQAEGLCPSKIHTLKF